LVWVREHDFKLDLLRAVSGVHHAGSGDQPSKYRVQKVQGRSVERYILFLVDDTLFLHPFSLSQIISALARHPAALTFSLRLGRNTTHCYSRNSAQSLPPFRSAGDRLLQYRWVGKKGDFGYPLEVSSSVFRADDLHFLLHLLPFGNPNRLEQRLAALRLLFCFHRPNLICYERSVAFCAPLNKVQSVLPNRSGESNSYSSEELHSLFEQGLRIDVKALAGFEPYSAHQEIVLSFVDVAVP
jgi:hypothetical protein